ncbi:hypothetical protein BC835DRAFT_265518 [Cytidiella melzeri]|nr:hypothetical protein BC835DRAFT_265518 [Cytidiella melzeri]
MIHTTRRCLTSYLCSIRSDLPVTSAACLASAGSASSRDTSLSFGGINCLDASVNRGRGVERELDSFLTARCLRVVVLIHIYIFSITSRGKAARPQSRGLGGEGKRARTSTPVSHLQPLRTTPNFLCIRSSCTPHSLVTLATYPRQSPSPLREHTYSK